MNELNSLKVFFQSLHVHFSDEWLESCIEWCKSESLPSNYTLSDLQSKVFEQWRYLDLCDLQVAVLPPNLSTHLLYTLNGKFCLQMMQIVDISKPKLWQLQKIRNNHALTRDTHQDSEIVGTAKRLLQMTLTDGVQEIEGMEYRPIPSLSLNLLPGTKIRIEGPIVIRRGRLMLEEKNVKILGGEVDDLLIKNAAENVLARFLNMKENPNPIRIEEKILVVEERDKNLQSLPKLIPPPKLDLKTPTLSEDQEIQLLLEAEAQYERSKSEKIQNFDEGPNFANTRTSTQIPKNPQLSMSLNDGDDDVFNEIDLDQHLDQIEQETMTPNVITISKLIEIQKNISKGVFRIKAKFKKVVEKLTTTGSEYRLKIKIGDSTGNLDVSLHSDIITEFAGYSVPEIMNLRNKVMGEDKKAEETMIQMIERVRERTLTLDNILMIQIEKNQAPIITKIL